jgi:2-keto-4-pentenoate hydratase
VNASEIEKAASLLADARVHNHLVDAIPLAFRPRTLADAYAIQSRLVELLGLGSVRVAID